MFVRIAEARDLHRLTDITTSSLKDDPAFDYMWSYWREFPEDNFVWWQLKLQKWLYDPKTLFLVAVLETADVSASKDPITQSRCRQDTIAAYAIWTRLSRSSLNCNKWHKRKLVKTRTLKQKVGNKIDMACTWLQQRSLDRTGPRRDANFKHVNAFFEAQDIITQELWSDVDEYWNLELLVTDRAHRRRGAATKLLDRLMRIADDEGVHCRVEASPMGRLLYESCEFKELGTWTIKAKGGTETIPIWCMRRSPSFRVGEQN